jgi:hypothetical protein
MADEDDQNDAGGYEEKVRLYYFALHLTPETLKLIAHVALAFVSDQVCEFHCQAVGAQEDDQEDPQACQEGVTG